MTDWISGYTATQLEIAQERYGLTFPPDLIDLYLDRRPAIGYDWNTENEAIRTMLKWPFDLLYFDIEHGSWWPDWGECPATLEDMADVLRAALDRAPKLIPLFGHRFIPETPSEAGNPIFSMHGFDTIYYGANLAEYFQNEFCGRCGIGPVRHIPFWSDIVENPADFYRPE